jgi:flagellar biosynthesis protein
MAPADKDDRKEAPDEVGRAKPRWPRSPAKPAIAVALNYKRPDGSVDAKRAPRVSASGRGAVAEQILEIAFAKGIPVREDPDLAQILATVEVDSVIPVDALAAVAEILSYLYRANGKAMDGTADGEAEIEQ